MNEELSLETIIDDVLALADELAEARKALAEIADVSPDNPSGFIGTMDDFGAWKAEADRKTAARLSMAQAVDSIEERLHEMIGKAFNVLPKGAVIAVGGRFAWKDYGNLYIDNGNSAVCISSHNTINRLIIDVRELDELTTSHLPEGVTMIQYANAVAELL